MRSRDPPCVCGVSPPGSSPWRTREAARSSRTGCPPPPRSCTLRSDSHPCWTSERTSARSVFPSLSSGWGAFTWKWVRSWEPSVSGGLPPRCPGRLSVSSGVSVSSEPVKFLRSWFIPLREPIREALFRHAPPTRVTAGFARRLKCSKFRL